MDNRINKRMRGIVVGVVCINTLSAFASNCENRVGAFLTSPSKLNYLQLVRSETSKASGDCWPVIAHSQENRDKIAALVATGNQWATRFVAINLKALDGGDLEDALIILGGASHSAPELLLSLDIDGTISDYELGSAAEMLPESFVDKKNKQINELRLRMESFKSVRNSRLSRPRSYVLKKLLSDIREIENARSE